MEARYWHCCGFCAAAVREGFVVYSPIVHWHPIAKAYELPPGFDYWRKLDREMIDCAEVLWVFTLEGWKESKGVKVEIDYAKRKNKEIHYVELKATGKELLLCMR
jgi:hypothetical protein